jgi:hypothetical protein
LHDSTVEIWLLDLMPMQCVHFYLPIIVVTNGKPVKSMDKSNVGFVIFFLLFQLKGEAINFLGI